MEPDWNTILSILAILSPILLAILGWVGWLYRHEKERREAIERQLSEHKYDAYITLLDIFFDAMKTIKAGKSIDTSSKDLIDRMIDANKDLILYGSDDVVRTFQMWISLSRQGKGTLKQFGDIVISIRRDMGNQNTKITSEEVLRQFIVDYDEAKANGRL